MCLDRCCKHTKKAQRVAVFGDVGQCVSVNGACGCTGGCSSPGDSSEFIAFRNPNGTVALIGLNPTAASTRVQISVDGAVAAEVALPGHSMNTFMVPTRANWFESAMSYGSGTAS